MKHSTLKTVAVFILYANAQDLVKAPVTNDVVTEGFHIVVLIFMKVHIKYN